jgi:hypothetical protein
VCRCHLRRNTTAAAPLHTNTGATQAWAWLHPLPRPFPQRQPPHLHRPQLPASTRYPPHPRSSIRQTQQPRCLRAPVVGKEANPEKSVP